ncbi:hypothetical protein HaLaN_20547 [Haematococcus lacustris]|uniref:Uncharacterized protein n=1 Tax=Haematococcus lacustris TaxID=44745 RepID=A0A6A0A1P7_HAELA|nr:hypothetical protein HaLaN_20547 [Haematococcus lacustris]
MPLHPRRPQRVQELPGRAPTATEPCLSFVSFTCPGGLYPSAKHGAQRPRLAGNFDAADRRAPCNRRQRRRDQQLFERQEGWEAFPDKSLASEQLGREAAEQQQLLSSAPSAPPAPHALVPATAAAPASFLSCAAPKALACTEGNAALRGVVEPAEEEKAGDRDSWQLVLWKQRRPPCSLIASARQA